MLDKLQSIADKYESLQKQQYDPNVIADQQKSMKINREMSSLRDAYELYIQIKQFTNQRDEAKELLNTESDPDMLELAKAQLEEAEETLTSLEDQIKIVLLPKDPNDEKDIFLEIRPAA
ncbi:MAG: PCRF domain-containing protein [Candidatus Peribacteria bacterium]|nr:MAG: PCRF domain-containing protein [Candidatus Peribacteria bacterium]